MSSTGDTDSGCPRNWRGPCPLTGGHHRCQYPVEVLDARRHDVHVCLCGDTAYDSRWWER